MRGYAVVVTNQVLDRAVFDRRIELVPPVVEAHGGRFLVRGRPMESVIGDWKPGRLVIVEFESVERARDWQRSPEYAEIKRMLQSSTDTSVILIEGV